MRVRALILLGALFVLFLSCSIFEWVPDNPYSIPPGAVMDTDSVLVKYQSGW